jgi:hypothetical protein
MLAKKDCARYAVSLRLYRNALLWIMITRRARLGHCCATDATCFWEKSTIILIFFVRQQNTWKCKGVIAIRIYLCGPMRGFFLFNFPAFDKAATALRELGHEVFSPADHDRENGFDESLGLEENSYTLRDALEADLCWIIREAEAVVCLDGWEKSRGAMAEVHTAFCIGIPVYELGNFPRGEWEPVNFHAGT